VIHILDARFVTTAVEPKGYPTGHAAEVAFVGRSNVGKSSMINSLTGRLKLVRVSNTPGRTRTLNFFDVDLERDGERHQVRLADLPGYGFAKVSKTDRAQWRKMISTYLEKREALHVVVSIIDAEVGPTPDDFQTLDYLQETADRRILVVATKMDRLPKARRKPRLRQLAEQLSLPPEAVVPYSSTEKLGVQEVWEALLSVMGEATRG
jgi:GTP-binding protein